VNLSMKEIHGRLSLKRLSNGWKVLIVVLVGLVMVLATAVVSFTKPGPEDGSSLVAVPDVNEPIGWSQEVFEFSSAGSIGEIDRYLWAFGDGNVSEEPNPTHAFEVPGWYDVTLCVTDEEEKRDNSTIRVGVQHRNSIGTRNFGRMQNFLFDPYGPAMAIEVGPSIANPNITVTFLMTMATGTFEAVVSIRYHMVDFDTYEEIEISREQFSVSGGMHDYIFTCEGSELPQEVTEDWALMDVSLLVHQGKFTRAEFALYADFSAEDPNSYK